VPYVGDFSVREEELVLVDDRPDPLAQDEPVVFVGSMSSFIHPVG
jgi:hypothetical protein